MPADGSKNILKHRFTKNDNRASEAGKKSTHGPLMQTSLLKILKLKGKPTKARKELLKYLGLTESPKNLIDVVNMSLISKAIEGNVHAIKEINERTDGRVAMLLEENEEEISLVFKIKKDTKGRAKKRKTAVSKKATKKTKKKKK